MRFIELAYLALAIIGFIFRLYELPFGSLLMVVGISCLAIFYFFLTMPLLHGVPFKSLFQIKRYASSSKKRIVGSILVGVSIAFTLVSVLFYLQFWPVLQVLSLLGLIGLSIAALVPAARYKKRDDFYRRLFMRLLPIAFVGAVTFFVPRYIWFAHVYQDHPEYVKAVRELEMKPDDKQLQKRVEKEREKMYKQ